MTSKRAPLTLKEAARYLGVSDRWVEHSVRIRRLPYYKFAGLLRFDPDDLDTYMQQSRVEAEAG